MRYRVGHQSSHGGYNYDQDVTGNVARVFLFAEFWLVGWLAGWRLNHLTITCRGKNMEKLMILCMFSHVQSSLSPLK